MKRGDSVSVAICTIRTPNATTKPVRPTIAPTIALSTVLAVDSEYVQPAGRSTAESSAIVISARTGPARAQTSGTTQRLPFSRCRRRKRAAHDPRGAAVRANDEAMPRRLSPARRGPHHPFRGTLEIAWSSVVRRGGWWRGARCSAAGLEIEPDRDGEADHADDHQDRSDDLDVDARERGGHREVQDRADRHQKETSAEAHAACEHRRNRVAAHHPHRMILLIRPARIIRCASAPEGSWRGNVIVGISVALL